MSRSKVADLLEKLTRLVPGISGYQDREKRRAADKAVRERAAAAVLGCREKLLGIMADLARTKGISNLESVGTLEQVAVKLERVEDELRFASYGYAGYFDREGIDLDDLKTLYEIDVELLEAAGNLEGLVGDSLPSQPASGWVKELDDAVESLSRSVSDRKKNLENEGS